MTDKQLTKLVDELIKFPRECEWVEFKHNFHSPEEIGERLSALSNGACIHNRSTGYLVFGVEDHTHKILGTSFSAKAHKKGSEDFEHWLATRLNPRIDFRIYEFDYETNKRLVIFVIPAARNRPVDFLHHAYIRVSSITRKLSEFSEKEAIIWRKDHKPFEKEFALEGLSAADVVKLLSTETYFDLLNIPYPSNQQGVIEKFLAEGLITKEVQGYAITKLGAILFSKDLTYFESVIRKSVRVIVYKGKNKVETEREQMGVKGYALGFEGLVDWINSQLPSNEEIGKVLRTETKMYPELAIRELVANALIHQDLDRKSVV